MTLADDVAEFKESKARIARDADLFDKIVNSPLGVDLTDSEGRPIDTMRQALAVLSSGGYDFTNVADPTGDLHAMNKRYADNNYLAKDDNLAGVDDPDQALINLGGVKPDKGTITPALNISGGSIEHSVQVGDYEDLGDLVHVSGRVTVTGITGSPTGNFTFIGLPLLGKANDYILTHRHQKFGIGLGQIAINPANGLLYYETTSGTYNVLNSGHIGTKITFPFSFDFSGTFLKA